MNGYICFWNQQKIEVYANTSYQAQQNARVEFQKSTRKKVKDYDISVVLAERDGQQVTHTPTF